MTTRKLSVWILQVIIALAMAHALVGCASSSQRDEDYLRYLDTQVQIHATSTAQNDAFAKMAATCPDGSCVRDVAMMAAFAVVSGRGNGNASISTPSRKPTALEQISGFLSAAAPIAGVVANAAVSIEQSRNSVRQSEQQWSAIGGIVASSTTAVANTAQSGFAANANAATAAVNSNASTAQAAISILPALAPSIEAGGDIVGRDQFQGPVAGDDVNSGTNAGNNGVIGDGNRQGSPGPFDSRDCSSGDGAAGGTGGADEPGGTGGAGGSSDCGG